MSGTTVNLFRSTDTGAPTLNGLTGSLVTLLDACLKDGYNTRTLTGITRNGQVATATFNGHGYAADGLSKIQISGADQAEYNGIVQISNVTANTFDYTVTGTPATPATGTLVSKVAPLGWGKAFTGTNIAAYRGAEVTGTKLYLRVDDTGGVSARVIGYETMSDVDTGTGLFPTNAQMSGGLYISKSGVANGTSVPWVICGDGYNFYLVDAMASNLASYGWESFGFGDIKSEMASDPFGCLIIGSNGYSSTFPQGRLHHIDNTYALTGHFLCRSWTQTGPSITAGKTGATIAGTISGKGGFAYPHPLNNGFYISPIYVNDSSTYYRGQVAGLYHPLHLNPFGANIVITANFSPIGRTLYSISPGQSTNGPGELYLDVEGPWR